MYLKALLCMIIEISCEQEVYLIVRRGRWDDSEIDFQHCQNSASIYIDGEGFLLFSTEKDKPVISHSKNVYAKSVP